MRAVICRNCATNNQQQHLPSNACALGLQKPHPAPDTYAHGQATASSGEIRRWRRQSVQMGRKICVCLSSGSKVAAMGMDAYI